MPERESIDDVYTRKVGGQQYRYRLSYTPGARVEWRAEVFQDDDLKGTPGGVVEGNTLTGTALRQSLVALVEITIENMLGIEE